MIPIQNVYYLLLYAWDALEQSGSVEVAADPETKVLDLLATVLNQGVDRLLRQGLHRAYLSRQDTILGVRGKLDLSASIKGDLIHRAKTVCVFDELSHDILHNQIIKATIHSLLLTEGLDTKLHEPLRSTWHRLHEVTIITLTERVFRGVQFHRNNRLYRFLIDVCHLLYDFLIPNQRTGQFTFRNFLRDERRMRMLFERFIRNFYKRHADEYDTIESESLQWEDTTGPVEDLELLPGMRTDITLRRPGQVLVIDSKYYLETLQEYRGRASIRSTHLYQLFAYLKNVEKKIECHTEVEGLIIYPLTKRTIDVNLRIHGHRVRVKTLNINQQWSQIHSDLMAFLTT